MVSSWLSTHGMVLRQRNEPRKDLRIRIALPLLGFAKSPALISWIDYKGPSYLTGLADLLTAFPRR